jgi:hypothetical protein
MPTTSNAATTRKPQPDPAAAGDVSAEGAPDAQAIEAPAWQGDPATRDALIRLAAYSFYERRGFIEGHELEDWLQAEMEVDRRAAAGVGANESDPAAH